MKLAIAWFASLVAVAGVTASITLAQSRPTEPRIVSGADIGFRIEGTDPRTGNPTGTLVVRVDGEWVEIVSPGRVRLLK
jgi:hypothetical protein